jgi:metal-responsive CopG/Arc/MetJ family transcriptional regulator
MPTKKNIIAFVADDEFLKQIDDYRRSQESIPSRSEAVRFLVEKGLKTSDPSIQKSKKK